MSGAIFTLAASTAAAAVFVGLYFFIDTFANSTRFAPKFGAMRVALSCISILYGCVVATSLIFFSTL